MRIPSGTTDQYVYFVAVDSTDFTTRETGLSSFTVYRSRDGGAAAAFTTPTINETDSTNMPGVYELLLDEDTTIASGNDSEEMCLHITHAGMAPVTRTIELYRPKATLGNTLDVTATGAAGIDWGNVENASTSVDLSSTAINLCDTVTTNSDMRGTDNAFLAASAPANFSDLSITVTTGLVDITQAAADKAWGTTTRVLTANTNLNDPTAATVAAAVWDALQSSHVTAGSFGEIATEIAGILADTNELQTDDIPGLIAALNDLSAADVNGEVLDVLNVDTFSQPGQGTPAATTTIVTMIAYLYKAWRNRSTQTSSQYSLYNDDATTIDQKATFSDDATTADTGEVATGP